MIHRMVRTIRPALCLLIALIALPGCIRRTISITSEPSGALVYLNDEEVGRTPTEVPFTFYGLYDVRLKKSGYATLHTTREAEAPFADTIGVDLFTEMLPGTVRVNLDWHFELAEAQPPNERNLVSRGRQLRALMDRRIAATGSGGDTVPESAPQPHDAPAASQGQGGADSDGATAQGETGTRPDDPTEANDATDPTPDAPESQAPESDAATSAPARPDEPSNASGDAPDTESDGPDSEEAGSMTDEQSQPRDDRAPESAEDAEVDRAEPNDDAARNTNGNSDRTSAPADDDDESDADEAETNASPPDLEMLPPIER